MGDPIRHGPDQSVDIDVLVTPRASRSQILGLHDNRLRIQVAAPPTDGAANDELIATVAAMLGCARGAFRLVRGMTSRRKTLRVTGLDLAHVRQRLGYE